METNKFDRVVTGEDKYKKKAKKYLALKEKLIEIDAEIKNLAVELMPFIEEVGEQKESGSISLKMSGKNFIVIRSTSEKYDDNAIFEILAKKIGGQKAEMAVPAFRKVNTLILGSLIADESIKIEDIKKFIKETERSPYIKVT